MDKAKALNVLESIQYSPDSVVSRTIIKEEKGTLTLFAFDVGQYLSEHSAPFDAVVQILEGEMDILIDGEENRVKAGEMIIMPADVPHALKAITKCKMMLIMIRK